MSYRLLMLLLWPVWFIYTLRIAWRERDGRYFKQRLGYGLTLQNNAPLWIHCASVGEVNTWLPLHQLLLQQYPTLHFVITTVTPTGARTVLKHALKNTQHVYLPIDTPAAVKRFLQKIRPRLALIMETELWPELYRQCQQNLTPLVIVNARLSHKTLNANSWIRKLYADALRRVSRILARGQDDADGYLSLGANPGLIQTIGSLKFSALPLQPATLLPELANKKYILIASTHADEEWQLAQLWKKLSMMDVLLVIAPRHPQRRDAILRQLAPLAQSIAVRSRGDVITSATRIYLADTLGEMLPLMSQAMLVVMGGSFVPHGGQNCLEPARLGKAIVLGPSMFNFAFETQLLLQHQACLQVNNVESLAAVMQGCIADESARQTLGNNAKLLMQQQADMASRYLDVIKQHYGEILSA